MRSVDSQSLASCLISETLFTRTTSCLESKDQVESVWSALPASSSLQDSPPNHHRCQRRPNLFLDVLSAHSRSSRHLAIGKQRDVHNARVLVPTLLSYNEHRHGRDSRLTIESHPMKSQSHRTGRDRESVVMFLKTIDRSMFIHTLGCMPTLNGGVAVQIEVEILWMNNICIDNRPCN